MFENHQKSLNLIFVPKMANTASVDLKANFRRENSNIFGMLSNDETFSVIFKHSAFIKNSLVMPFFLFADRNMSAKLQTKSEEKHGQTRSISYSTHHFFRN